MTISVGLLIDTSGSMRKKIRTASQAADRFFRTANPEDEFFLIEFNERPKLTVPFTNDTDESYRQASHAGPFGRTSRLDAIHMACANMKAARNTRRAILIVSDGGDNHSHMTARQVRNDVLEGDLQTYAIGILDDSPDRKRAPEEVNGPDLLQQLADQKGGRHYRVDKVDDLVSVGERVSTDLRNEYLLGYLSTNAAHDGKYRRVKVAVGSHQVNARAC
jgi:Ca-activated chloride channel family protein